MEHDHPFDLLANEAILPVQFYPARRDLEPEKRLALAVLEDAIRCLSKPLTGEIHRQARIWVSDEQEGLFTFNGVCDLLGIEASVLRARLKTWHGQLSRRSAVHGNGGARPTVARVKR